MKMRLDETVKSLLYTILTFAFLIAFYAAVSTAYDHVSYLEALQKIQKLRADKIEEAVRELRATEIATQEHLDRLDVECGGSR